MSISALSSNLISDLSQTQNPFRQIRQDFRQLASALQSGDLTQAQSAYSSIQQILQANGGSSASTTASNSSSTLQNDFAALGQALQSGDLGQAQSAFSQLQSDAQASRQPERVTPWGHNWAQGGDQYVSSQGQNSVEQALQDYAQLASSLQSGNLAQAQSAYSNLQQLVPTSSTSTTQGGSAIQNDFATLGQDLQSGDLTDAQTAFTQFQNDLAGATQSVTNTAASESPVRQVRQDYTQLANALQSGDLTGAQSAYSALQQALQTQTGASANSSASSTSSSDPIATDFNALGQALSSGDLSQAQSAFSQLQSDIKTAQPPSSTQAQNANQPLKMRSEGHHGHHRHGGGGYSSQSSSSTSTSTGSVNVYG